MGRWDITANKQNEKVIYLSNGSKLLVVAFGKYDAYAETDVTKFFN